MSPSNNWVCLSALYKQTEAATTFLDNRGLAYGDGFFTTMGVMDGQILWLSYHHQRLISHAKALQLDVDSHSILSALQTHAEQLQQGVLKLIITRAEQDIRGYGYLPSMSGSACEVWLKSLPLNIATANALPLADGQLIPLQPTASAICLSSQIACLPPPLAGLKSLNRLDNVLASGELQAIKLKGLASNTELNIAEGLLRDMSGHWVEGTMSNVFYQLSEPNLSKRSSLTSNSLLDIDKGGSNYLTQGQWYTPSMAQSAVAGVMRQVLIDTLSTSKYPVIIRSLKDEDLPQLSQLFFCNALRGIMPMSNLTLLSGEVVSF